ncbi:hypothetical protein GCM10011348_46410 [Marinobacterium nitratireducens]|uniref:Uncharacterized protein n=1 Tax=Marinobacterium nitratireducens TaxID=518897 RepID=A0A918DXW0_9GAMM|nr:hypothetical protein [Marinobacterium nitratireducens]GGO89205.1 hypothetical protein GCM10011348_46410 [Marinobacterium nitratireducens]
MNVALITPLIFITMAVAVFADWQHGVEWGGNIALFASWLLIAVCFFGLLIKYDNWLESSRNADTSETIYISRICLIGMIVMQVAAGWVWTPAILTAVILLCWSKFAEFKKRKRQEAEL